jgi:hypothetical protein
MTGFYRINAYLSAQNGAKGSMNIMTDLAHILDTRVLWGGNYNDDFIRCPSTDEGRAMAETLMDEAKLVYEKVERLPYHHPNSYENSTTETPRW